MQFLLINLTITNITDFHAEYPKNVFVVLATNVNFE